MQATRSDQRLEEKFGEVGEAVRVNANLSDHLAEIFSIIFKDPQHIKLGDEKRRERNNNDKM